MPKQIVKWSQVEPGDIVSFRYRSDNSKRTYMQTVLILNPKIKMKLKDGTTSEKVIGLKLEQSNKRTMKYKDQRKIFESIGNLKIVDEESEIYRLANPIINQNDHTCKIKFIVIQVKNTQVQDSQIEVHNCRYFFEDELKSFFHKNKFELKSLHSFPNISTKPNKNTWNALGIAIAI